MAGEIQGVLPNGRTFEFKLAGQDEVVRNRLVPPKYRPFLVHNTHCFEKLTLATSHPNDA